MEMYTTSTTEEDLLGILSLQKSNLAINLTKDEISSQGFVTVKHSYASLMKLNEIENHIVAKDGDKVVAYVLAMTKKSQFDIPVLEPMFDEFNNVVFEGRPISTYNYIVIGQVCVDKNYRGKGIFDKCYSTYKDHFSRKYDFAITDIASTNLRSLQAHKRIGFKEIHKYTSPDKTEWIIVLWNWKNGT